MTDGVEGIQSFDQLADNLSKFPQAFKREAVQALMWFGPQVQRMCRMELQSVRDTGQLDQSFAYVIRPTMGNEELSVWPTAEHGPYVRMGTRPHWAPIEPLKGWAARKLGDEKLAYPVQRSIAEYGTSMFQMQRHGLMSNPWPIRVVHSPAFQRSLRIVANRLGEKLSTQVTGDISEVMGRTF